MRAGMDQSPYETQQVVSVGYDAEPCRTSTEGDEFGWKLHLIKVIETQDAVAQADSRKHRIVLAKVAMSRDVNDPAVSSPGSQ